MTRDREYALELKRARNRAYRARHPEQEAARNRRYREANRDELVARDRARHQRNRELLASARRITRLAFWGALVVVVFAVLWRFL